MENSSYDEQEENKTMTPVFYEVNCDNRIHKILPRFVGLEYASHGAQGAVFRATDTLLNMHVAIKRISLKANDGSKANTLKLHKLAYRELAILGRTNHVNIVKIITAFTSVRRFEEMNEFYIVMEWMTRGTLRHQLQNCFRCVNPINNMHMAKLMTLKSVSFLIYQIVCGIKHLHDAGMMHRDLKPENLGVTDGSRVKILDFGLARKMDNAMTPWVVTLPYRAPELLLKIVDYDNKVDIWSVGCVLAEMLFMKTPFCYYAAGGENEREIAALQDIIHCLGPPPKYMLEKANEERRHAAELISQNTEGQSFDKLFKDSRISNSEESVLTKANAKDLLKQLLKIDPLERLSARDALDHPFVAVWKNFKEVNAPSAKYSKQFQDALNGNVPAEATIDTWKEAIFDEIQRYRPTWGSGEASPLETPMSPIPMEQ